MSAALHAETPVKSTVSKTVAIFVSTIGAATATGWYVALQVSELNRRLASIEGFIRHEVVTQSQAERYAASFRWENRNMPIVVPAPSDYQDKPKS
jgi:hypothetical protein